jgi:hypothetical protein
VSTAKTFDQMAFAQLLALNVPVAKIARQIGISRAQAFRRTQDPEIRKMAASFRSQDPETKLSVEMVDRWLIDLFQRATTSDRPSDRTLCGQLIRIGYDRLGIREESGKRHEHQRHDRQFI